MAEEIEWWDYDDATELAEAVAGDVGFIIEQALEARGRAIVAFPGGDTPKEALGLLAARKIEWADVTTGGIIQTDVDTYVPSSLVAPTGNASLEGM